MSEFIHSVLAQNDTVAAGTVVSYDLPVNPLSFIFVTLRFQQDKADLQLGWDNVVAMISKLEVLYKGSPVFSASGADITALQAMLLGYEPWICNRMGDDNEYTTFTFLIPMTRFLYSPKECFPRSTRGELVLQITYAASFTDIDGVSIQAETIELPDATPTQYLRTTTLSVTPSAAGELDIELPIGNRISGVLFYGTTIPLVDDNTQSLTYSQLLVDNMRHFFSQTNHETWRQLAALKHKPPIAHGDHIHQIDGSAFAQYMDVSAVKYADDRTANYLLWDFDPLMDGTYELDTAGASDVIARIYTGDTTAIRVLPMEIVGA